MQTSTIFALILNTLNFAIHWNIEFMDISYNKIYTLKYIRNKITIHFITFWYFKKITQQFEHKIHYKSLYFSTLLKTPSDLQQNFMFYKGSH